MNSGPVKQEFVLYLMSHLYCIFFLFELRFLCVIASYQSELELASAFCLLEYQVWTIRLCLILFKNHRNINMQTCHPLYCNLGYQHGLLIGLLIEQMRKTAYRALRRFQHMKRNQQIQEVLLNSLWFTMYFISI